MSIATCFTLLKSPSNCHIGVRTDVASIDSGDGFVTQCYIVVAIIAVAVLFVHTSKTKREAHGLRETFRRLFCIIFFFFKQWGKLLG